ncbi:hypothetical protein Naga_100016g71 [Nannochloropsis gaditana]|uniref:Uncharacterized protein n=1 Tax=Nannochloropsis gaditana TaxID=72520 RepID=W7TNM0_9STRA|nr:hypothetical protein Naga_100016g71 [Nannochloropsis gaditana]
MSGWCERLVQEGKRRDLQGGGDVGCGDGRALLVSPLPNIRRVDSLRGSSKMHGSSKTQDMITSIKWKPGEARSY